MRRPRCQRTRMRSQGTLSFDYSLERGQGWIRVVARPERTAEARGNRQAHQENAAADGLVGGTAAPDVALLQVGAVAEGEVIGLAAPRRDERGVVDDTRGAFRRVCPSRAT